ncbi:MAG: YcxB family protein [Clostridiales bacterium]|nr:YcxB family protein [Clostridiales bacterium]
MHSENHLEFTDELINRTGFYLWMHSRKCRLIRICFYAAMLISTIFMIAGLLRTLVLKTDLTMMLVFLVLLIILFLAITIIWPLVYRSKAISQIHKEVPQIITMDDHFINLHTSMSHQRYKWHHFDDYDEDDGYYYLFSPDVYIILDRNRFNEGGEEVFLNYRKIVSLRKNTSSKSKNERYLMIFTGDYLTPIVNKFRRRS